MWWEPGVQQRVSYRGRDRRHGGRMGTTGQGDRGHRPGERHDLTVTYFGGSSRGHLCGDVMQRSAAGIVFPTMAVVAFGGDGVDVG